MFITVIRTTLLYLAIVISLRIMGKRQISEMQPTELVCTILISNLATLPIEDSNIPFLGGIVPIFTIVCLEVFVAVFSMKSRKVNDLVSGNACIVMSEGKINQEELIKLRLTADDLISELHAAEIYDPREVRFAAFETSGKLSIYKTDTAHEKSGTPAPTDVFFKSPDPPMPVISDGDFVENNFGYCKTDEKAINKILAKKNHSGAKEIFLMIMNPLGEYYIISKEDKA